MSRLDHTADRWLAVNDPTFLLTPINRGYYTTDAEQFFGKPRQKYHVNNTPEFDNRPAYQIHPEKLSDAQKRRAKDAKRRENTPVFLIDNEEDEAQILRIDRRDQHIHSLQLYGHGPNIDIVILMLRELSVRNIAQQIGRSERTVRNAREEIKARIAQNKLQMDPTQAGILLDGVVSRRAHGPGGRGRIGQPGFEAIP